MENKNEQKVHKAIMQNFYLMDTLIQLLKAMRKSFDEGYELITADIKNILKDFDIKRKSYSLLIEELQKERKKLIKQLQGIAETFNETESEIFVLHFLEHKNNDEIAKELDLSSEYVRQIISRQNKALDDLDTYEAFDLDEMIDEIEEAYACEDANCIDII